MNDVEPAVYSAEEVAKMLKVTRQRVYQMASKDLIPGKIRFTPNGKWCFQKSAIDALVAKLS